MTGAARFALGARAGLSPASPRVSEAEPWDFKTARAGFLHYTSVDEVDRLLEALA